ncbi:MAG: DMT family transporter [Rhodobacteraceae bacterium]|nr:DMT family transporter [Paracoccaceae bacterium]
MKLVGMLLLVLLAFAGNSVLNRLALVGNGAIGALEFATIRVIAGAVALIILVRLRDRHLDRERRLPTRAELSAAGALTLYLLGFSFAYLTLPAGLGALILFGGVQITMFAGAVLGGENVPRARWIGATLAFGGLVYLLWPSGTEAPDLLGALLMGAAAVGWGIYSLLGRGSKDPLSDTSRNFLYATVPVGLVLMAVGAGGGAAPDVPLRGALLGIASGAITSGLGYALWFRVLPTLAPSTAAVAQLTVPLIAMAGGMIFLAEPLTTRFIIASAIVLGGVAYAVLSPKRDAT